MKYTALGTPEVTAVNCTPFLRAFLCSFLRSFLRSFVRSFVLLMIVICASSLIIQKPNQTNQPTHEPLPIPKKPKKHLHLISITT